MDTTEAQGIPDDDPEVWALSRDEAYWFGELSRLGLTSPQAEKLATRAGVDRHAVRESLVAAKRRGTLERDADLIFDAYS